MDKKKYYKEIQDFFTEITWNAAAKRKLEQLTDELVQSYVDEKESQIIYVDKIQWRTHYVTSATKKRPTDPLSSIAILEDFNNIALEVCVAFDIRPEQLKVNNPKSSYSPYRPHARFLVTARSVFAKTVLYRRPDTPYQLISDYIGYKDHTSVMHLLYYSKLDTQPLLKKEDGNS